MKFINFSFNNFKGISNVTIDIQDLSKPLCLLGLNESGKTTILKAIDRIGDLCKGGELKNGDRLEIRPKGVDFTGVVRLETDIILDTEDVELIKQKIKKDETRDALLSSERQIIKVKFEYHFKEHSFTHHIININNINISDDLEKSENKTMLTFFKEVINQNIPTILYYDDFMFDMPDKIYFDTEHLQTPIEKDKEHNKIWTEILEDIYKATITTGSFVEHIVEWLSNNPEDNNTIDNRLNKVSDQLNKMIIDKWNDISKNESSFTSIIIKSIDSNYSQFNISVKANNNTFKIHERSIGFRWFFAFLIFTEFRKNREKNMIFLLDEPASNLHASAQEKIRDALQNLCSDANVIYSTHSHYLLDYNNFENILLIKNECNEYGSPSIEAELIRSIIKNKSDSEHIKPLLDHIAFKLPEILREHGQKLISQSTSKEETSKIEALIKNNSKEIFWFLFSKLPSIL